MNRRVLFFAASLAFLLWFCASPLAEAAQKAPASGKESVLEDGIYVYDLFQGMPNCKDLALRVRKLSLRPTVILSLEQGSEFVLDRPDGEALLECALKNMKRSSRTVKGLFLQDTSFLRNTDEAIRRALLLENFIVLHPKSFAGVQVDVEPYAAEEWRSANPEARQRLIHSLTGLLHKVRECLPEVPLSLAIEWWSPVLAKELPEASPQSLFQVADDLYLMVYGEEGGPVVGGSAQRVLERLNAPELFAGPGRIHVVVGAYEFHSRKELETELKLIRDGLSDRAQFAGTAVFSAQSTFDAPLLRVASGKVTDPSGMPLDGVAVEAAGVRDVTNPHGEFQLRGLPESKLQLVLSKEGFQARQISIEVPLAGVERELGNIVLEKTPDISAKSSANAHAEKSP